MAVVGSAQKYLEKIHRRLFDQKVNQLNRVYPTAQLPLDVSAVHPGFKTQASHPSEEVHNLTPTHGMYRLTAKSKELPLRSAAYVLEARLGTTVR